MFGLRIEEHSIIIINRTASTALVRNIRKRKVTRRETAASVRSILHFDPFFLSIPFFISITNRSITPITDIAENGRVRNPIVNNLEIGKIEPHDSSIVADLC